MLDPVLDEFGAYLRSIKLSKPTIPWVSNRTGTWVTDAQATDPQYWVDHLRGTVRFSDGVATLAAESGRVFLEGRSRQDPVVAGPYESLRCRRCRRRSTCSRHAEEVVADDAFLLGVTGRLWAAGGQLDTAKLFEGEQRLRVSLPHLCVPGGRKYFSSSPANRSDQSSDHADELVDKEPDASEVVLGARVWRRRDVEDPLDERFTHLVFADSVGVGRSAGTATAGRPAIAWWSCAPATAMPACLPTSTASHPSRAATATTNCCAISPSTTACPTGCCTSHCWPTTSRTADGSSFFHRNQELGFYSLLFLAQAWSSDGVKRPLQRPRRHRRQPAGSTIATAPAGPIRPRCLGPASVMAREIPDVTVSVLDLSPDDVATAVGVHRGSSVKRLALSAAARAATAALPVSTGSVVRRHRDRVDACGGIRRCEWPSATVSRWVAATSRRAKGAPQRGQLPLRQGGAVLRHRRPGWYLAHGRRPAGRAAQCPTRAAVASAAGLPPRDPVWDDVVAKLGPDHVRSRIASHRCVPSRHSRGQVEVMAGRRPPTWCACARVVAEMRRRFGRLVHGVVRRSRCGERRLDGHQAPGRRSEERPVAEGRRHAGVLEEVDGRRRPRRVRRVLVDQALSRPRWARSTTSLPMHSSTRSPSLVTVAAGRSSWRSTGVSGTRWAWPPRPPTRW